MDPPVVCVSQHTTQARPRSTLASVTEIHDHLRLLWARFGTPYCPNCAVPIRKHTLSEIADTLGVTSERIRQIESAALSKLRQPKLKHKLREYLDEYVA